MSTRSASPEISLFPFLSILVCLIGALVLLIVVMTVAQSASATARLRPEEIERARAAAALRAEIARVERAAAESAARREKEAAGSLSAVDRARLAELRLKTSPTSGAAPDLNALLQDLRRQAADLLKGKPPVEKDLQRLRAELAARLRPPPDQAPTLRVEPSGTATLGGGRRPVFIETSRAGLSVHRAGEPVLRVPTEAILSDERLRAVLSALPKAQPGALVFLVRPDGLSAFNRGAGWAEQEFGLAPGKLPLPGKGAVDLSPFGFPAPVGTP
jgi:hypothetical protein